MGRGRGVHEAGGHSVREVFFKLHFEFAAMGKIKNLRVALGCQPPGCYSETPKSSSIDHRHVWPPGGPRPPNKYGSWGPGGPRHPKIEVWGSQGVQTHLTNRTAAREPNFALHTASKTLQDTTTQFMTPRHNTAVRTQHHNAATQSTTKRDISNREPQRSTT